MDSPIGPEKRFGAVRLWAPIVGVTLTLFVSSHFSGPPAGPNVVGFDKVAHFCVFGLLATLFFRPLRIGFLEHRRWLIAFACVSLYAALDEGLQYFNPGRSFDPLDWLADGSGALLALALYRNWAWYRSLLEINIGPRLAK